MGTRFGVLGALEVVRDGVAVAVPALKQRIALATLLPQANQHVSLDQLAERMWDGREAPDDARGAVQTYIGRLRRTLLDRSDDQQPIHTRQEGFVLKLAVEDLDVAVFLDLVGRAKRAGQAGTTGVRPICSSGPRRRPRTARRPSGPSATNGSPPNARTWSRPWALAADLKCPEYAAELAYHLTSYLAAHHYDDDVVRVQRTVMTIGDTREVMRARLILANADVDRGRFHDALAEFEALFRHFTETGDRHAATYAMTGRGVCRHVLSDHQAALADLTRAVSLFRDLGDDGGALHALLDLSAVHLEVCRYDDAIGVCHAGLELTAGGRNSLDRSRLLRGLGIAHYEKGQVDAAIRYYEESLRLTGDLDYDGGEPKTLRRLGGPMGRSADSTRPRTCSARA